MQDSFEIQADAIKPGQSVIIVDDLIATGEFKQKLLSPLQFSVGHYSRIFHCVFDRRIC